MFRFLAAFVALASINTIASGQGRYLIRADRVFDGQQIQDWTEVLVVDGVIEAVGTNLDHSGSEVIDIPGATIMPGMIDAHTHLLLHPYDETSWNDQVLKESRAERAARATVHAERTLLAGFTTIRDLGSEGAGYDDVGIKVAIQKGVIPGPRVLVAGPAIVATGSYGPKGFAPSVDVPLGAEEADGTEGLTRVAREQIGGGADVVKVYADYRWGPNGEAMPTFSTGELETVVEVARSSGRVVIAHAGTAEGMLRATNAGVKSIEHGDGGNAEVFGLMAERGVALCPTLAAVEAISRYQGWDGSRSSEPARISAKRASLSLAAAAGVPLCVGSDAGVYDHGDNGWELELMVDYGIAPIEVLRAATSQNADLLEMADRIGTIETGMLADIIAVDGNPVDDISAVRRTTMVMKDGQVYKRP